MSSLSLLFKYQLWNQILKKYVFKEGDNPKEFDLQNWNFSGETENTLKNKISNLKEKRKVYFEIWGSLIELWNDNILISDSVPRYTGSKLTFEQINVPRAQIDLSISTYLQKLELYACL